MYKTAKTSPPRKIVYIYTYIFIRETGSTCDPLSKGMIDGGMASRFCAVSSDVRIRLRVGWGCTIGTIAVLLCNWLLERAR